MLHNLLTVHLILEMTFRTVSICESRAVETLDEIKIEKFCFIEIQGFLMCEEAVLTIYDDELTGSRNSSSCRCF